VAKSELGTKRVCPDTGRKFYDLNKTPVVSPYTGKIVPIAATPARAARPETAPVARPVVPEEAEIVPEAAEAEFVSLEEAETEQQGGKKPAPAEAAAEGEEEEVEIDESLDDAAFIEEEEEGDEDVTDIIGDGIEKEDET
jgi:uncharacterized protein (TIGR02300 family)